MCMTSNKPIATSGYASPLPYQEESPVSACQLASLGVSTFAAVSCAWAATNATPASHMPVVSACTSPNAPAPAIREVPKQRQRVRRRQELPLPLRKRTCQTPKERFAAFVAILLMHLDGGASAANGNHQINPNYKLSIQAKALVAECCRRASMGDVHFSPLQESLSARLHGLVGAAHWNRARKYLQIYLARHHGFRFGLDELEEDQQLLHFPSSSNRNNSKEVEV